MSFTSRCLSAGLAGMCLGAACAVAQDSAEELDARSERSLLAMIEAELEETLGERAETGITLGMVPSQLAAYREQAVDIGEVCQAPDPSRFFQLFAGPAERPVDVGALAASVYSLRPTMGHDAEEQLSRAPAPGGLLPWRAVMDTALGTWKRVHYHQVDSADALNPTEIAIVWRTWCRVGVENDALLGEYLSQNGFPTDRSATPQIAAQAFNVYRHTRAGSPVQELYVDLAHTAFDAGELDGPTYALILDTDAQKHGRPLPYATFVACRDGEAVVAGEVADADNLDDRRAAIGLWPLEVGLAQAAPICAQSVR